MPDLYDRHEAIAGVSGANPLLIPRTFAANAVNRWFRNDENANRAPFQSLELTFDSEEERIWFAGGNVQGAFFYNSYPSFQKPYIIVSIAGRIFRIQVSGREGRVTTLFQGNDPVLTHTWFTQGFEWLIIQNGYNPPIVWDGTTARRAAENEVPTGGPMAVIHGRLVVTSADGTNQIAVGDIVYGEDQTSTIDVIRFTETEYWSGGGAFGAPVYIGDLMGLMAMPYLDTGTGQNELVVLGSEGAISMNLSIPREQWPDSQIIRISLAGGGCVSSHSLCTLNGDLLFRSAEGIRSYRNARAEFTQTWKQAPISSDVSRWLDYDAPDLLQYNNQVSWNNLLLSTCSPMLEGPNSLYAGFHRYHRGMVVMDANPESNTARSGAPLWQGMWSGIRPTALVDGRIDDTHRCFAFSYDRDGKNRLYEINRKGFDNFEGQKRKMVSFYDTSTFGTVERTTSTFSLKELKGGELELSELKEAVSLELSVRPDSSPCYVQHASRDIGCDCPPVECPTPSRPGQARFIFAGIDNKCDPSTKNSLSKIHHWQARLKLTGNATVDALAYRFSVQAQPTTCSLTGGLCEPITCCPDADSYEYHLAPAGDNAEVPNITRPSDVPLIYTSTKSFTASCPPPSVGASVMATGYGTSAVSQEAADAQALSQAQTQAYAQLRCSTCSAAELVSFTLNNSTVDLSTYFTTTYENFAGRPWRLVDAETLDLYGLGVVNDEGTLTITFAQTTGSVTFDNITYIIEDTSGTDVPVRLQIGCPTPNGQVWGDIDPY